jgi:hypothetical protein
MKPLRTSKHRRNSTFPSLFSSHFQRSTDELCEIRSSCVHPSADCRRRRSEFRRIRPFPTPRTPLQWALITNKEDVVRALVQAGADVNYGSPRPVTIAASLGRVVSLNLLIEHNVDLSA